MGNIAGWRRFSSEMHVKRTSDYGRAQTGGKKYKRFAKKALKKGFFYVIINIRDILTARIRAAILAPIRWGARDHKEVKQHDKI